MTDIVDDNDTAAAPRPVRADYVPPTFGDSPEGTHIWQRVPYNADDYGPVSDFATDFDHADPSYNPVAPQVWKELRENGCPVAHSGALSPSRTGGKRTLRGKPTAKAAAACCAAPMRPQPNSAWTRSASRSSARLPVGNRRACSPMSARALTNSRRV